MMYKLLLLLAVPLIISCSSTPNDTKEELISTPKVDYQEYLNEVLLKRDAYQQQYKAASETKKQEIIKKARAYLMDVIANDVFAYWYGTPWDFNGTTRTPGKGKIACGYFVTNVLSDVGFDIPRVKWPQSASEVFITQLADEEIKRFSNQAMKEVRSYLTKTGDGLYLVGLDSHVGFVYVKGKEMKFIHSNYYSKTKGVVIEELETHNPLNDSAYRVFGKLFSDKMMKIWILNKSDYKN